MSRQSNKRRGRRKQTVPKPRIPIGGPTITFSSKSDYRRNPKHKKPISEDTEF